MAYIGKTPTSGDFVLLDSITTSATASYTMQKNSVNFTPQSANHMIVSLNGTIQAPVSSFTVSGSTITFASALTSSDVIDFVLVLGNVNDVGVASSVVDSAITKNKTDFITDGSSAGVTVKGSGSDSGSIALNCSSNSHAIQLISPDHSAGQSYKLKLPDNNVTADKFIKVKSITGSGATATGQLEFADAGGTFVKVGDVQSNSTASTHDLTGIFSDTYDSYFFTLSTFPVNANYELHMQFLDGSNNAITSSYYGCSFGRTQAGVSVSHSHAGTSEVRLNNGHSDSRAFQCHGYIKGPTSGITNNKQIQWYAGQHDNLNVYEHQTGSYFHTSATDYTGLRVKSNGTNLTAISLQVYGITDSKNYNG